MNRSDPEIKQYARVISKESSLLEKEVLLTRLRNNPKEKAQFDKLEKFWKNYSPEIDSSERIWELTSQKLGFKKTMSSKIKVNRWWLYASAAMIILSFGLNFYFVFAKSNEQDNDLTEYSAQTGEVKQIQLPDGSKVWLNSESSLIFHEKFKSKNRIVFLTGEAFFKVMKNPDRPFLVNTSNLTIKVLGTSFNVRNYRNDQEISTSLVEGKVDIQNKSGNEEHVLLMPAEEAIYNKSDSKITIKNKEINQIATWREGRFRFQNASFEFISHQLERKFGCEFVFADSASKSLRFTAEFENENLKEILNLLNNAHAFNVKTTDKQYVISILNNTKKLKENK